MSFPNNQSGEKKPASNKQKAQQSSEFHNNDYLRTSGGYSNWNSDARPGRQDREETQHGSLQAKSLPYAPESSYQQQYQQYDPYYSNAYYYDYNFNESGYSYQDPDRFHSGHNHQHDSQQGQRMHKRNNKTRNPNSYNNLEFEPAIANNGQQFYHLNNQNQHNFKQQHNRNKNSYPMSPQNPEQHSSFNEGKSQTHDTSQSGHLRKNKPSKKKTQAENSQTQTGYSEYQVKDSTQTDEHFIPTDILEKKPNRRTDKHQPEAIYDNSYGRSGPKFQGGQSSNLRPQLNSQTSRKSNAVRTNQQTKQNPTVKTHNHFTDKFVLDSNHRSGKSTLTFSK
jgi:hypothetical protein